jgi:hypothetical protein
MSCTVDDEVAALTMTTVAACSLEIEQTMTLIGQTRSRA